MIKSRARKTSVPWLKGVDTVATAYAGAWRNHVQAVNSVWQDVTSSDATAGTWVGGMAKVLQAWGQNASDLYAAHLAIGHVPSPGASGLLNFVLDHEAQASDPQTISLPRDVDPNEVTATELAPLGPHAAPGEKRPRVQIMPSSGRHAIEVSIFMEETPEAERKQEAGQPGDRNKRPAETYIGHLYADGSPQSKTALATVVLTLV